MITHERKYSVSVKNMGTLPIPLDVVRQKLAPIDPIQGGRGLDAMIDYETTFSSGKYILLKYSYYWIHTITPYHENR